MDINDVRCPVCDEWLCLADALTLHAEGWHATTCDQCGVDLSINTRTELNFDVELYDVNLEKSGAI